MNIHKCPAYGVLRFRQGVPEWCVSSAYHPRIFQRADGAAVQRADGAAVPPWEDFPSRVARSNNGARDAESTRRAASFLSWPRSSVSLFHADTHLLVSIQPATRAVQVLLQFFHPRAQGAVVR